MRPLSFRNKLILGGLGIQLCAATVLSVNSARVMNQYLRAALQARVNQLQPLFNSSIAAPMAQRDFATIDAILTESIAAGDISYIVVLDSSQKILVDHGWPVSLPLPDPLAPQPAEVGDGSFRFDYRFPIQIDGVELGYLQYGLSADFILKARNELFRRTAIAGGLGFLLFASMIAFFSIRLTKSLEQLAVASKQIRVGNFDVELVPTGKDEIGSLTEDFRHMAQEVKRQIRELTESEALQRHFRIKAEEGQAEVVRQELEKASLKNQLAVQEAISAEAKKVASLVDNMQQAVFTIDPRGTIVEPVSKFSTAVFGAPIVSKNILDTLYSGVSAENKDKIRSAMTVSFGETELQWVLSAGQFPSRVDFIDRSTSSGKETKALKVTTAPIWDSLEVLEKVLFVVEDVTSLERLEVEAETTRRRAKALEDVLACGPSKLSSYLSEAKTRISLLGFEGSSSNSIDRDEVLRDLHTLKGNAGTLKLSQIASFLHEQESKIAAVQSSANQNEVILEALSSFGKILQSYRDILDQFTNSTDKNPPGMSIARDAIRDALDLVDSYEGTSLELQRNQLREILARGGKSSLHFIVQEFTALVQELARSLDRQIKLSVEGEALVDEETATLVKECVVHLIRNSADHGIESPQARVASGKPPEGNIVVQLSQADGKIGIAFRDDGKGLDPDFIAKRAIEKGIITETSAKNLSEKEKLQLIFTPGFSTKAAVSEISGRGVGMDVVQTQIQSIGGTIEMTSQVGRGTTFQIAISEDSDSKPARA